MQPSENDELTDRELDALLPAWQSPPAPAKLRAALFPEDPGLWWRRLWHVSVRIPMPIACCLAILLALIVWKGSRSKTIYRDRVIPAFATTGPDEGTLRPVTELRPRVIRSGNVQN